MVKKNIEFFINFSYSMKLEARDNKEKLDHGENTAG